MIKVYIASPYTKGDVAINVRKSIDVADRLVELGFLPFVPLFSHFWHMIIPHQHEYWMKMDFEWVRVCDCVLRLEGESSGADSEVALARDLGKPIFYSVGKLCLHYSQVTK